MAIVLKCILCFSSLEKPSDKNRVDGRGEFKVLNELLDLPTVIIRCSDHICKKCLTVLKRRKGLKENLKQLDKDIKENYERTLEENKIDNIPQATSKRKLAYQDSLVDKADVIQPESMQTVGSFDVHVTDGNQESMAVLEETQTPTLTFEPPPCKMRYSSSKLSIQNPFVSPAQLITSTPHKQQSTTASRNSSTVEDTNMRASEGAASSKKTPTKAQETIKRLNALTPIQEGATSVQVKVVWKSKVQKRELQADLASLGKMLCRGTYEQIANAAWRCKSLRPHLVQQVLKQIVKECDGLCSSKYPSYLRKTEKNQLMNFSFKEFDNEFEERAPLPCCVKSWVTSCQ